MSFNRRDFLQTLAAITASLLCKPVFPANTAASHLRLIPKTGQTLPAIGMGTWITFAIETEDNEQQLANRIKILETFFANGGGMIDSSPMYGTSEEVIGYCLKNIKHYPGLFSATKVWTTGWRQGMRQMSHSQALWGTKHFDLMQIHNLLDWETHLETLKAWKAEGKIQHIGITTSHGRRHAELIKIMQTVDELDFVQFTYNIEDRVAEQRLLPIAKERNLATIINRPFQGGSLFNHVNGKPLPPWAKEFDCQNWAQFFLKFIISHPAVTVAIPATSQVVHMEENMGAMYGRLPDEEMRKRMVGYFEGL